MTLPARENIYAALVMRHGKDFNAASGMAGIGAANTIVTRRVAERFRICDKGAARTKTRDF